MKPGLPYGAGVALVLALLLLTGCGGGSASPDLAAYAPPASILYVEGTVRPDGELKSEADAAAERIAGAESLRDLVLSELESSDIADGEPIHFAGEVEPWLGDRAGAFFEGFDGGDFTDFAVLVQTTNVAAAQDFVDGRMEADPVKTGSYQGFDYRTDARDYTPVVGIVDDLLVVAEDVDAFESVVDASRGRSLADESRFDSVISAAPEGSLADVYVDVGTLVDPPAGTVERRGLDPQVLLALRSAGIDPAEATAVASIAPGADRMEGVLTASLGDAQPPSGEASDLLGSLPASSLAAAAVAGLAGSLQRTIDDIDAAGIQGTVPPGQLKRGLRQLGIDLEGVAGSVRAVGAFALGSGKRGLGGALVLRTAGSEALESVASVRRLLRGVRISGVTPLNGRIRGFAVRDDDLGDMPLVVAAREKLLVVGYGMPATLSALAAEPKRALSDESTYREAVSALGDASISAFVDGPTALRRASSLVPRDSWIFSEARPYLKAIRFLALGTADGGDPASAKLIIGLDD